jgi:hypothetical protein
MRRLPDYILIAIAIGFLLLGFYSDGALRVIGFVMFGVLIFIGGFALERYRETRR